jgi:HEPN domain-containing protein
MGESTESDSVSESDIAEERTPISLLKAYQIGTYIGYVRYTCQADDRAVYCINNDDHPNRFMKYSIEKIISSLKECEGEFLVIKEMEKRRDKLHDEYGSLDGGNKEEIKHEIEEDIVFLTEEDTDDLEEATVTWGNLLKNHLKDQTRIPVSEVGLFNSKKAMESPEMLFDNKKIWKELPDDVTRDLSEACRSLAAGCPTSAVFLSLRALEQRLHAWYVEETDNEIEDRTFGQVLGEIDDQYDDDSRPRVLDHLDYLVDRRNEVAHAEETPDQQEAENTLMLTRTTISNISGKLDS